MKKGMIALSIISLMLSGCGKKNSVEEDFSGVQGTTATSSESTVEYDETTEGEEEHKVEYTVSAKPGIDMVVDLTIDTRIPEHVVTKRVKKVQVDDAYLASLASSIFDRGEYEVLSPAGCKLDALDETLADVYAATEQKANEYGLPIDVSVYYQLLMNTQASNETGEFVDDEVKEGAIIHRYEYGDEYGTGYDEEALLKGNINGAPYIMKYSAYAYGSDFKETIGLTPYDGTLSITDFVNSEVGEKLYGDNTVAYDTAASMAEDYIEQLGFSDYAITGCYETLYNSAKQGVIDPYSSEHEYDESALSVGPTDMGDTMNIKKNGYRFVFTPAIDSLHLSDCGDYSRTTLVYDEYNFSTTAWGQPSIIVEVNETGLSGIFIDNIYELEETLADDSKLLSFEQADEYAREAYEENFEYYAKLSDIALEYIIIEYEKEKVMVPAWVYYNGGLSGDRNAILAVNALDGSVVYFNHTFMFKF